MMKRLNFLALAFSLIFAQAAIAEPFTPTDGQVTKVKNGGTGNATGDLSALTSRASAGNTLRRLEEHFSDTYEVGDFGAKCDGEERSDFVTTAGSPVVSSVGRPFTSADVGKVVEINSNGNYAILATGTVVSVSGGNATLSSNALFTGSNLRGVFYKTDDTTAIQAAIDYASTKGGGYVKIPPRICAVSGLNQKRLAILEGQGRQASMLYLIAGSNASIVKSENFDALTGTGLNYGPNGTFNGIVSDSRVPSWFGLKNIRLDGNRFRQSVSKACGSYYGNAQIIDSVFIQHCSGDGIYTEASGGYSYSQYDWKAQEEGFINDLVVRNVNNNGWTMRGPHDSIVTSYLVYDWGHAGTGYYGFRNEASANYSGSSHFWHLHAYTSAGGDYLNFRLAASGDIQFLYSDFGKTVIASGNMKINTLYMLQCGVGGATPCLDVSGDFNTIGQFNWSWFTNGTLPTGLTVVNFNVGADGNTISNISGSSTVSTTANNTVVKNRGNFNNLTGVLVNAQGTGNVCADLGGSYNTFDFRSFACTTHLQYTAGGFHNEVKGRAYRTGGEVALNGTPNSADSWTWDGTEQRFDNVPSGSAAQPGLTFGGVLDKGFWGGSNVIGLSFAGTEYARFDLTGLSLGTQGSLVGNLKLGAANGNVVTVTPATGTDTYSFIPPVTAGTAGSPLLSGAGGAMTYGTRSGNTTSFATTSGTLTSGNRAVFDASGNIVDGGAPASGTVTSVAMSGGSTGLNFTGGPITGAGTFTASGTVAIGSGGTGATTASGARAALGSTAVGDALFTAGDAIAAQTTLGLAPVASSGSASDLTTGNLSVNRLNSGASASSTTFWRGDGTWAVPAGGGGGSGTVNSGITGQIAYYTATGTAVSGTTSVPISAGGTGQITKVAGAAALGVPKYSLVGNSHGIPILSGLSASWVRNNWKWHYAAPGADYTCIKVKYVNWVMYTNSEKQGSFDYTLRAGLNYNGKFYRFTFGGKVDYDLPRTWGNNEVWSDPLCGVTIKGGTGFYITNREVAMDGGAAGSYSHLFNSGGRNTRRDGIISGNDPTLDLTMGAGVCHGSLYGPATVNGSGNISAGNILWGGVGCTAGGNIDIYCGGAGCNTPGALMPGGGASAGGFCGFTGNKGGQFNSFTLGTTGNDYSSANPPIVSCGGTGTTATGFGTNTSLYTASVIAGIPSKPTSNVLLFGDSNMAGFSAVDALGDINGSEGMHQQALTPLYNNTKLAVSGESCAGWHPNSVHQKAYLADIQAAGIQFSHVVNAMGCNDFLSNTATNVVSATESCMAGINSYFRNTLGVHKIYGMTLSPQVNPANSKTDRALMVPYNVNYNLGGRLETYNNDVRALAMGIDDYVDTDLIGRDQNSSFRNLPRTDAFTTLATSRACSTTSGSNVVTMADTSGLFRSATMGIGDGVTNIPGDSTITSITRNTSVVMSRNATATGATTCSFTTAFVAGDGVHWSVAVGIPYLVKNLTYPTMTLP